MWRDRILRSPKLYIGHDWNADGLHALVLEIIRLAADPQTLNGSTIVATTLHYDGSLLIEDNGRGLPVQAVRPYHDTLLTAPALELILTIIFERHPDQRYHARYGFLTYLGVVLNAVAARLEVDTTVDGEWYSIVCAQGAVLQPLQSLGSVHPAGPQSGTQIAFWPDPLVFGTQRLDEQRLRDGIGRLSQSYRQVSFGFGAEPTARSAS